MAVVLYRKGVTHTVNGIRCEAKVFNEMYFESNLGNGWYLTPEQMEDGEREKDNKSEPTNAQIRTMAKINGIENYSTARIKTLKEKLENVNSQS